MHLRLLDFSFFIVFHVFHAGFLSYDTAKNCLNLYRRSSYLISFYSVLFTLLRTLQILSVKSISFILFVISERRPYWGFLKLIPFWPILSPLFAGILIFVISSTLSYMRVPYFCNRTVWTLHIGPLPTVFPPRSVFTKAYPLYRLYLRR